MPTKSQARKRFVASLGVVSAYLALVACALAFQRWWLDRNGVGRIITLPPQMVVVHLSWRLGLAALLVTALPRTSRPCPLPESSESPNLTNVAVTSN